MELTASYSLRYSLTRKNVPGLIGWLTWSQGSISESLPPPSQPPSGRPRRLYLSARLASTVF